MEDLKGLIFGKNKFLGLILFCIAAEAINCLGVIIFTKTMHLPLFFDTIGTVVVVFFAGLVPGVLVALFFNILWVLLTAAVSGMPVYPWDMMYALCGIAITIVTWLFARKKDNFRISRLITILYLVLIALVSAFASSFMGGIIEGINRIRFANPVYESAILDNFVRAFLGENMGTFASCVISRIPITVVDRLICTFAGFGIYRLLNSKEEQYAD